MKWGFVRTNVRIRWNLIYKAFHRICLCGNKPIVRSSFKRDLDAANLRPLLEQGCGKHAPSASIYFSLRIWYIFWILICRRKVDLGVCVTSVLAKRMRLRNADFRRILQPNTFLNQKSALCRNIRHGQSRWPPSYKISNCERWRPAAEVAELLALLNKVCGSI